MGLVKKKRNYLAVFNPIPSYKRKKKSEMGLFLICLRRETDLVGVSIKKKEMIRKKLSVRGD